MTRHTALHRSHVASMQCRLAWFCNRTLQRAHVHSASRMDRPRPTGRSGRRPRGRARLPPLSPLVSHDEIAGTRSPNDQCAQFRFGRGVKNNIQIHNSILSCIAQPFSFCQTHHRPAAV